MRLWKALFLSVLLATGAQGQEGIWEDSLPLDVIGSGGGGSVCADHDSTDIDCSGEQIFVTDDQHNHTGATLPAFDPSLYNDLTWGDDSEAVITWTWDRDGAVDSVVNITDRGFEFDNTTDLVVNKTAYVDGGVIELGTLSTGGWIGIYNDTGAGSTTWITTPDSDYADWTLTLPADNGDPDEFLQTDGDGNTTWASPDLSGYLPLTGGTLDGDGDLTIMGRLHVHDGTDPIQWPDGGSTPDISGASLFHTGTTTALVYDFSWGTGEITAFAEDVADDGIVRVTTSAPHGLSTGNKIAIGGTTNYNAWETITVIDADEFDITATWVANDATGDWGLRATEAGQRVVIQSRGKTSFLCSTGALSCGSLDFQTSTGDETEWIGEWNSTNNTVFWRMLSITKAGQSYANYFLEDTNPQTFGTAHLGNVKLRGVFDLGAHDYLPQDDVTPNVQDQTIMYSWVCEDNYDAHCIDLYNSRSGGPCANGDVQCSGTPDTNCDFDGVTSTSSTPQRVNTAHAIDLFEQEGGNVVVTNVGHGLYPGFTATISGTTSYDGEWTVIANTGGVTSVTDPDPPGPLIRITTDAVHGLSAGEGVHLQQWNPHTYYGDHTIVAVTATTFDITYAFSGNDPTNLTWRSLDRWEFTDTFVADESDGATYTSHDGWCDADPTECVDYYDTPSTQDIQISGDPDDKCDYNGITATDSCTPDDLTLRNMDGGDGSQWLTVITSTLEIGDNDTEIAQEIHFECSCTDDHNNDCGTPPCEQTSGGVPDGICDYDYQTLAPGWFDCGDETIPQDLLAHDRATTQWAFNDETNRWKSIAYENFSSLNKAQVDLPNTFEGLQTFADGITSTADTTTLGDVAGSVNLVDILQLGPTKTITLDDATPDVSDGIYFETAAGHTAQITDFDGGSTNQPLFVRSNSSGDWSFDCDGITFVCGATDLTMEPGDTAIFLANSGGAQWRMFSHISNDADYNDVGDYLLLAGGTMTGDAVFNDNINAAFGDASDATISYDGTNLLIDPQAVGSGHTDFTDAIMVSLDEDVYSQFGPGAGLSPTDAADGLVATKVRTASSGSVRAMNVAARVDYDGSHTAPTFALNTQVQTLEGITTNNSRAIQAGGMSGGRYRAFHNAAGTYAMAGGIAGNCLIGGGTESGVITNCYTFLDEGSDGGAGAGSITNHTGLWIKDSIGNVDAKAGIWIEDLANATANVGIQIDGASNYALWFNNDSGTANDGIFFGASADVNLYRSGADVLKTDDSFVVLGDGTGTFATYDVEIGSGDYGAIRLGSGGIYSSSFATGNIDLGKTMVFRQEQTVDGILEFAWIEGGNTLRAGIPESGAGNATNFFRSFMIAGPYSAATGDNHFICDTHTAHNGNIDCDTGTSGADMFIQDDLEVEGTLFAHETINLEGSTADGNHVILAVEDPASDITHTFPSATGKLLNSDRKCIYVNSGLTTGLQLESIWAAHLAVTITGIWCETDAGTTGADFNIDDGSPAGVNGSDISCSPTPTWDQTLAGDVTMAQGDRLDLDVGTVATATRLTACFDFTVD